MITKINPIKKIDKHEAVLGELKYGTLVKLTGYPSVVYVKVDKLSLGQGITINWPPKTSVLLNIQSGTLRAIKGWETVKVVEGELNTTKAIAEDFKK